MRAKRSLTFLLASFLILPLSLYGVEKPNMANIPLRFFGAKFFSGSINFTTRTILKADNDVPGCNASGVMTTEITAYVNLPLIPAEEGDGGTQAKKWGTLDESQSPGLVHSFYRKNFHTSCGGSRSSESTTASASSGNFMAVVAVHAKGGYMIMLSAPPAYGMSRHSSSTWDSVEKKWRTTSSSQVGEFGVPGPSFPQGYEIIEAAGGAPFLAALGVGRDKFHRMPFPVSGPVLSGSSTIRKEDNELGNGEKSYEETLTWYLSADGQAEYELEVEIDDYEKWLPEGTHDGKASDKTLTIRAKLIDKKSDDKTTKAEYITFELPDVSREPGVAMNWPEGGNHLPDLRFEKEQNKDFEIGEDGQLAMKIDENGVTEAVAKLSSFDWGAFGKLKVTAAMGGDVFLTGILKGKDEEIIRIPERDENSNIANEWKNNVVNFREKDEDDGEDVPAGDGHNGDGLTLYEEYRGFYATEQGARKAEHIFGNPRKKDFFVANALPDSRGGIKLFKERSQLEFHEINERELSSSMQINFNHGRGAHSVDQHGVLLLSEPGDLDTQANEGPGTPGMVRMITVNAAGATGERMGVDGTEKSYRAVTIAHELFHACNVWHHGDKDYIRAYWELSPDGSKILETSGAGREVEVDAFTESGTPIDPRALMAVYGAANGGTINVGLKNGQHSGQEDCIMRYDIANAYIQDKFRDDARIMTTGEKVGWKLCTLTTGGDDVNLSSRGPLPFNGPRYYDADKKRGNCKAQICVNDKHKDDASHKR